MKDNGIANPTEAIPTPGLPIEAGPPVPAPATQRTVKMPSELSKQWNTKNLGLRLGADIASAASAASMIAPVISIIDRSIMENASGRRSLSESLKQSFHLLLTRPHKALFSRPVALIFMLYGGTYLTANTLDTASSTLGSGGGRPATYVSSGTDKFAASSAANVGLCIYKDQVYVRLFGPLGGGGGAVPRPVPAPTYALFALRDCLTIFASFNVPPLLGPAITDRLGAEMSRRVSGETVAQFAAPAAVQLLSTPIHLLGLDMYNRPRGTSASVSASATSATGVSWADRWSLIRKNWLISSAARICRIVPAFGLGGTVNMKVRRNLMEKLC